MSKGKKLEQLHKVSPLDCFQRSKDVLPSLKNLNLNPLLKQKIFISINIQLLLFNHLLLEFCEFKIYSL